MCHEVGPETRRMFFSVITCMFNDLQYTCSCYFPWLTLDVQCSLIAAKVLSHSFVASAHVQVPLP
jgi:hypothetical protein